MTESIQEWRDIPGYRGRYKMSRDGRVMMVLDHNEKPIQQLLKPSLAKSKGGDYGLYLDGKRKRYTTQRLLDMVYGDPEDPEAVKRTKMAEKKRETYYRGKAAPPRSTVAIPIGDERFMTLVCVEFAKATNFQQGVSMKAMMKALTAASRQCGYTVTTEEVRHERR